MWSIGKYCESQQPIDYEDEALHPASRLFLETLDLPSVYPFCNDGANFYLDGIPPMGNLDDRFEGLSILEQVITSLYMVVPALWALSELWLRLFAAVLSPLGILYLILDEYRYYKYFKKEGKDCPGMLLWICMLCLASSMVLMTDTLYVLDNGDVYGTVLFAVSLFLSTRACLRYRLSKLRIFITLIILLTGYLVVDYEAKTISFGDKVDKVKVDDGLYHNPSNSYISSIIENWPEKDRTYNIENGATSWMPSGDSRTGLPFLLNKVDIPEWKRLFLQTEDEEYVALDISFPPNGHDTSKPIYMVLHGLNGGSHEEYVRDLAIRRTAEGSTVVVMVARGLMDLPIRGWNTFHGARVTDAHMAASTIRRALATNDDQILIGVGYSMGAIVLNNYVASYGPECALDAAISLSGGLDMRYQEEFPRAQRLWQPMLTETARNDFFLGKFGKRAKARLSDSYFRKFLKAKHITELDIVAITPYNGFDDVKHYYREMSALGDVPFGTKDEDDYKGKRIDTVSIPLVVVHAFDDPLITWRTICGNDGLMRPESLVKRGSGNLMLLLTKAGGHVGWPVGELYFQNQWKWMSDVVGSFGTAVHKTNNTSIS